MSSAAADQNEVVEAFHQFLCFGGNVSGRVKLQDVFETNLSLERAWPVAHLIENGLGEFCVDETLRFMSEGRCLTKDTAIYVLAMCMQARVGGEVITEGDKQRSLALANQTTRGLLTNSRDIAVFSGPEMITFFYRCLEVRHWQRKAPVKTLEGKCGDAGSKSWDGAAKCGDGVGKDEGKSSKSVGKPVKGIMEIFYEGYLKSRSRGDFMSVAREVTKKCLHQNRHGWRHKDVLKMLRLSCSHGNYRETKKLIIEYLMFGWPHCLSKGKVKCEAGQEMFDGVYEYLGDMYTLERCGDDQKMRYLVEKHGLEYDHMPTNMRLGKEVWASLLPTLTPRQLIQYLPKLAHVDLLTTRRSDLDLITKVIMSDDLHPAEVMWWLHKYKQGHNRYVTWEVKQELVDVITVTLINRIKKVEPSSKSLVIGISLGKSVKYRDEEQIDILAVCILHLIFCYKRVSVIQFYNGGEVKEWKEVDRDGGYTLPSIKEKLLDTKYIGLDPCKVMEWCKTKRLRPDAVVMFANYSTNKQQKDVKPRSAAVVGDGKPTGRRTRGCICYTEVKESGKSPLPPELEGSLQIYGFNQYMGQILHQYLDGYGV